MTLEFKNITAAYQKKTILDGIRFTAASGSITALIGCNGAGKSTLLRCMTGEKQDYRGSILLDGRDVRRMEPQERAALLSCLPQNLPRPRVTVRELVAFGRAPYTPLSGKLNAADREQIRWALNAVGIENIADSFVDTLSGGERKKAFFAMTLAQDTPVVALDEPTAHLDAASRFEFLVLLDSLRKETGKVFLMVMHELPEVLQYADHIVALHDSRIVFDGSPADCLEAHIPETYFQIQITGNQEQGYAVIPRR